MKHPLTFEFETREGFLGLDPLLYRRRVEELIGQVLRVGIGREEYFVSVEIINENELGYVVSLVESDGELRSEVCGCSRDENDGVFG